MAGMRVTKPRVALVETLMKLDGPVSIERIHQQVGIKSCDLVTIYRCLAAFENLGLVRRSYLLPDRRDADLQAWQLSVTDSTRPLTGFDGKPTTATAQVKLWKATFTPTVLFLGPKGQELAERLVGAAIPDFYGAYLDERLITARKVLLALR